MTAHLRAALLISLLTVVALGAHPTFAAGPSPAAGGGSPQTVSLADNGRSLSLHVGDRLLLFLGEDLSWSARSSDTAVVNRLSATALPRGAQGVFEAEQPGKADLTATGTPNCAPGTPCAQPAATFVVHIVVAPLAGSDPPSAPASGSSDSDAPLLLIGIAAAAIVLAGSAALLWRRRRRQPVPARP